MRPEQLRRVRLIESITLSLAAVGLLAYERWSSGGELQGSKPALTNGRESRAVQRLLGGEPSTNTAMLARGGGGRRKAPEKPKVVGSALLWCFNPGRLMGGAGGAPSRARWELPSTGDLGRGQLSLGWDSCCFWLKVGGCSQGCSLT